MLLALVLPLALLPLALPPHATLPLAQPLLAPLSFELLLPAHVQTYEPASRPESEPAANARVLPERACVLSTRAFCRNVCGGTRAGVRTTKARDLPERVRPEQE